MLVVITNDIDYLPIHQYQSINQSIESVGFFSRNELWDLASLLRSSSTVPRLERLGVDDKCSWIDWKGVIKIDWQDVVKARGGGILLKINNW